MERVLKVGKESNILVMMDQKGWGLHCRMVHGKSLKGGWKGGVQEFTLYS